MEMNLDPTLSLQETMCSGGVAAAISSIFTYPLDLARSRLAVTPRSRDSYKNYRVFRHIFSWYRVGGVRELYRYYFTTCGYLCYSWLAFTEYALVYYVSEELYLQYWV